MKIGKFRDVDQDQCMPEWSVRQRLSEMWETLWPETRSGLPFLT